MLSSQKYKAFNNYFNFLHERYNEFNFKAIIANKKAPRKLKNFIFEKEFLRKGLTKNRYRCFVTNNARNVYSKLNISRFPIKNYGFAGRINGFFKSSW